MRRRLPLMGLVLCLAALLALPGAAHAGQTAGLPLTSPETPTTVPPGFSTNQTQVLAIAKRTPQVQAALRKHPRLLASATVWQGWRWQVDYAVADENLVQLEISPAGKVMKVWTGVSAKSYQTHGTLNPLFRKPWVWLPFALLFLLPFVDPRRLRRLLHLDLLAMLSFGISYAFLDAEHANWGVALFYPPLLYVLGRLLYAGLRPRRASGLLVPYLPTAALIVGVVALFGARVALNVDSSVVMDIGYASVVGADRINEGEPLYVDNETHGDTYGPINYVAYVPFEAVFPYHGVWDRLPAAHAAAIAFDLLTIIGLFFLGRQLRAGPEGRRLGLALAWAWAAFPFTLLSLLDNTNDLLVAMLLVWMLVLFASPIARGGVLGLATAAKFFPGALLLVAARGVRGDGRRVWIRTAAACLGVFLFSMAVYFPADGGLRALWDCTLGFQISRRPDLSLFGMVDGLGWLQVGLEAAAVLLAAALAVIPGRRTLGQVAALSGAIVVALQLPGGHWFFYYVVWFTPLMLAALFAEHLPPPIAATVTAAPSDEERDAAPLARAS